MTAPDNPATGDEYEPHSDNDPAGRDGVWGSDLGSADAVAGTSYTLPGAAVLFLASLLSCPSAFDQLCRKARRKGLRRPHLLVSS
jgi:hypothetical protein